jgi:hypothetical protein
LIGTLEGKSEKGKGEVEHIAARWSDGVTG